MLDLANFEAIRAVGAPIAAVTAFLLAGALVIGSLCKARFARRIEAPAILFAIAASAVTVIVLKTGDDPRKFLMISGQILMLGVLGVLWSTRDRKGERAA